MKAPKPAMEFHAAANLLPMLEDAELADLAKDIVQNGQREPIYTFKGKILDGRNRYLACQQASVKPKFKEWDGRGSLIAFVISENLKRRHLTPGQKAYVSEGAEPFYAAEAKARQRDHAGTAPGKKKSLSANLQQVKGKASEKAAKVTGASARYVSEVKAIKKKAPKLGPLIRDAKLTVPEAKLCAELPEKDQAVLVDELNNGRTLSQAAAKLSNNKLNRPKLPTTAQARKIAIATGQPVLDNTDHLVNPITQEEQDQIDRELHEIDSFAQSVVAITAAAKAYPPDVMVDKLSQWMLLARFKEALPAANQYLTALGDIK